MNPNSAVRKPLRRLKQTKLYWPFSSWQTTTSLQISITISTEFPNCQNRSRQRCPRSTGNLRSLKCLKIFCKRASKFTVSWLKMTESTNSSLSRGKMLYRHLKNINGTTRENFGEIAHTAKGISSNKFAIWITVEKTVFQNRIIKLKNLWLGFGIWNTRWCIKTCSGTFW